MSLHQEIDSPEAERNYLTWPCLAPRTVPLHVAWRYRAYRTLRALEWSFDDLFGPSSNTNTALASGQDRQDKKSVVAVGEWRFPDSGTCRQRVPKDLTDSTGHFSLWQTPDERCTMTCVGEGLSVELKFRKQYDGIVSTECVRLVVAYHAAAFSCSWSDHNDLNQVIQRAMLPPGATDFALVFYPEDMYRVLVAETVQLREIRAKAALDRYLYEDVLAIVCSYLQGEL